MKIWKGEKLHIWGETGLVVFFHPLAVAENIYAGEKRVCSVFSCDPGSTDSRTLVPTPPLNIQAVLNQIFLFLSFKTSYPHTVLIFSMMERRVSMMENRENLFPAHLWL